MKSGKGLWDRTASLPSFGLLPALVLRFKGPLRESGWFRTVRRGISMDASGDPIPWLSYGATNLLEERVRPEMRVFEYGCGNSTLWWSKRAVQVVSCEHDKAWYDKVRAVAPGNVQLLYVPLDGTGQYARTVAEQGCAFNVIVIDGRDRAACALHAESALTPTGVIVWDDTDREGYREGCARLREAGFRVLTFSGFGPVSVVRHETSILYRPGNCLGI